jgi:hypothetical protein
MKALTARISLVCLFALLCLSGCFGTASKPTAQYQPAAQVVEVPTPTYVPLFPELTLPITEPPPPPKACTYKGQPAVCVLDGLLWSEQWRGNLDQCNADRSTSQRITTVPSAPLKQ